MRNGQFLLSGIAETSPGPEIGCQPPSHPFTHDLTFNSTVKAIVGFIFNDAGVQFKRKGNKENEKMKDLFTDASSYSRFSTISPQSPQTDVECRFPQNG